MSRMQREKGKRFERAFADVLRKRWPATVVRRASQAERADNPDVFVEGHAVLDLCWFELQDARAPTPRVKLEQAERDIAHWLSRRRPGETPRWPIVVWHKLGERTTWATMPLWVVEALRCGCSSSNPAPVVTMDLGDVLDLIEAHA